MWRLVRCLRWEWSSAPGDGGGQGVRREDVWRQGRWHDQGYGRGAEGDRRLHGGQGRRNGGGAGRDVSDCADLAEEQHDAASGEGCDAAGIAGPGGLSQGRVCAASDGAAAGGFGECRRTSPSTARARSTATATSGGTMCAACRDAGVLGNDHPRPMGVVFDHSKHIRMEGVTVQNSGFWQIVPYYADDLVFRNIRVLAPLRRTPTRSIRSVPAIS